MPRKKLCLFMVVLLTILLVTSPTFARTASEKAKAKYIFLFIGDAWESPNATPPTFCMDNMGRAGRKRPGCVNTFSAQGSHRMPLVSFRFSINFRGLQS
jgi:hypothetical protein